MSDITALFNMLAVVVAGLRIFLLAYFVYALAVISLNFLNSSHPESEEELVARIKEMAQKINPDLFNVAVLVKHGRFGDGTNETLGWKAVVCAFEPRFKQIVLGEGKVRWETRLDALKGLDMLLKFQLEMGRGSE